MNENLTVGRITFAPNTDKKDLVAEQYKSIGQVNIPHNLSRTPSDREQKLVEAARAVIKRWESIDWKAAPTADYMNTLRNVLEAYDTPGSQGGEKSSVYHIPLYDADGKVTLQPVACYPADEEEEPISEEELAKFIHDTIDTLDVWEDGVHEYGVQHIVCEDIARALAKRLGWM